VNIFPAKYKLEVLNTSESDKTQRDLNLEDVVVTGLAMAWLSTAHE
jgi:hypothetical protein